LLEAFSKAFFLFRSHSDVSGWTIQLGITRRHAHAFYGQKMKVKNVVPHPLYNLGVAHDNDVALFQLSSRVDFHEHLLPVCLPPANKQLHPGTICTVIGWGKKEDTGMSEYEPEVNEVEVPVLNRDLCNAWLENRELNVTDGMICAGYKEGGKDACQGDSGGPLLCRDSSDPDRWFVGGIVSWGIKCAHPHLPGVYAYVPKYIPWILQQMKHYSD
jgi:corin